MNSFSGRLRNVIAEEEPRLRAISEESASARSGGGAGWSMKQELGHLIDSATNNRVRFIKAALENQYSGPSYDGDGWVELGGYSQMPWTDLIDLWKMLNRALAVAVDRIPRERLSTLCLIGDSEAATLEFVIDDYILHMQHHLDHILSREHLTTYPGATMGI
jgi:DinB superfamily